MTKVPISKQVVTSRTVEIENAIVKLKKFQSVSLSDFKAGENFAIAEHYLRRALEAIFDIGNHIVSRIPAAKPESYKDIPTLLAHNNIINSDFENKLKEMAGYRNRLIHFYKKVTTQEMYDIICNDLEDIEQFLRFISLLLKDPQQFDLEVK